MEAATVLDQKLLQWASLAELTDTPEGIGKLVELSAPKANLGGGGSSLIPSKPDIPNEHCEHVAATVRIQYMEEDLRKILEPG